MITHALLIGTMTGFLYTFCAFASILTALQFSLQRGGKIGFIAGMGHATAQIVWIAIAIGAASLSIQVLDAKIDHYKLIAAVLLFVIAMKMMFSPPTASVSLPHRNLTDNLTAYLMVFTIAISAPARTIGYLALYMLLGERFITSENITIKLILLLSTLLGVVLWWLVFSFVISKLKIKPSENQIKWLQRIIVFILIALAFSFIFYHAYV